jgi:DNA-binding Lrp family transcriptional regulator
MLEDGRLSYRKLAKVANVSTPTAETRIKRMVNSGFIKKIVPVFDAAKVEHGVSAIVYLKVDPPLVNEMSSYLQSLEQIRNVFLTTGEWNMIIRIACLSNEELQSILDDKIVRHGITIVNSQVITRTMKDEQGFTISPEIRIGLTCDYCGGDIKGNPFKLKVGEGERYFCCKTCMNSYKERYGSRIAKLEKVSST